MEKEENLEQALASSEPDGLCSHIKEQPQTKADESRASVLGRFSSPEQLLKAYVHLEAEFTKRCQKLKELERCSEVKPSNEQKEQNIEQLLNDERFVLERIATDEKISSLIVSRYLSTLHKTHTAPILSGTSGISPLSPQKKPKSLEEAKRLADILLKG